MTPKIKKLIIPFSIFLFSFLVYTYSLCPTNSGYADSDELITTSILLGVPHPSGYPLHIILTKLFTLLPFNLPPAYKANLLSTFLHSLTIVFIYLSSLKLLNFFGKNQKIKKLSSALSVLTLAFSSSFWLFSTTNEVFPLNNLLFSFTLFFALSWYQEKKEKSQIKLFYLLCLFLGLGLSHHHTFILILPGLFLLFLFKLKSQKTKLFTKDHILGLILIITIFFLVNSILLFLNHNQADLSWYFDQSFTGWLKHIFRHDYSQFNLEKGDSSHSYLNTNFLKGNLLRSFFDYFRFLSQHFTIIPLLLLIPSFILLFKKNKKLFYPLLLLFLITGPLFTIYMSTPESTDISYNIKIGITQRLLLLSEIILAFLISISFYYIFSFLRKNIKDKFNFIATSTILSFSFLSLLIFTNYQTSIQKNNFIANNYAHTVLEKADKDSIIVCVSDFACYSLFYAQKIEGVRPDIIIISKSTQINKYFIDKQNDFKGFNYLENPHQIADIISWNLDKKTVYFTDIDEIYDKYFGLQGDPFFIIPQGYLYQVTTQIPDNIPDPNYSFSENLISHKTPDKNYLLKSHKTYFAYNHTITGQYFLKLGKNDLAIKNFNLAIKLDPEYKKSFLLLTQTKLNKNPVTPYFQTESSSSAQLLEIAKANFQDKQFDLAYSNLLKACYLDPTSLEARLELVGLYEKGNFRYQAKREFLNILKYHPDNQFAQESLRKYEDVDLNQKSPDKYLIL